MAAMTIVQTQSEAQYLDLYGRYLDEPDIEKRRELILQMQEIERQNGWKGLLFQ